MMALHMPAYNLKRIMNIMGNGPLLAALWALAPLSRRFASKSGQIAALNR